MARDVYQRTASDAKRAGRELKKGDRFYVVRSVATNVAPYEDDRLYSEFTVTGQHPLLGGAMVGGISVEGICLREGPIHLQRPTGIRNIATPGPQVAGPLPAGEEFDRPLDADEIAHLEKLADEARQARTKRKSNWW
ncbi:hypothetical protein HW130_17270 [Streptomyces sp. PKU-EA00015]|uniref:hypothetical protein n=1 Tax=Streptomyces sp. PKU-EA00015 TaxID=2748326 RepID=UPI0015A47B43|nr:hypothetical protein [Streptomyces sp. PKU-EA00015]NWF27995.1 hypothetical protein [Streptomyces sp. PKU-EA00015]